MTLPPPLIPAEKNELGILRDTLARQRSRERAKASKLKLVSGTKRTERTAAQKVRPTHSKVEGQSEGMEGGEGSIVSLCFLSDEFKEAHACETDDNDARKGGGGSFVLTSAIYHCPRKNIPMSARVDSSL